MLQQSNNLETWKEKECLLCLSIFSAYCVFSSFLKFQNSFFCHLLSVEKISFWHFFRVVCWRWILLVYMRMSWFSLHSWRTPLLGTGLWNDRLFFIFVQHGKTCLFLLASKVFDEKSTVINIIFPLYVRRHFSHCSQDFSYSLFFRIWWQCVLVWIWVYLFEICSPSWICSFMSPAKFEKFSATICLNTFSAPSSLIFPSRTPVTQTLDHLL